MKFTLEENLPRLVVRRRGPGRSWRGHRHRGRPGLRGQEAGYRRHHSRADPDLPESRRGRHPRLPARPPRRHRHARLADQSAAVNQALSELISLAEPGSPTAAVAVPQRGPLRISSSYDRRSARRPPRAHAWNSAYSSRMPMRLRA